MYVYMCMYVRVREAPNCVQSPSPLPNKNASISKSSYVIPYLLSLKKLAIFILFFSFYAPEPNQEQWKHHFNYPTVLIGSSAFSCLLLTPPCLV